MHTGIGQSSVNPQVQVPSASRQRNTECGTYSEAKPAPVCARCGRSDGPLEPEPRWKDALVCSFTDREAWSDCWRKSGPHCPPWCVGTHQDELQGIASDDVWLHRSKGSSVTLSADGGGTPETFRVSLYACEQIGGTVAPADLFIDRELGPGHYQDNMMMSTENAQTLALILMKTASITAT